MTRTSKALKRLGVAGVAIATIGAGVPAFFATAAQATTTPTNISIAPPSQTGAAGTCLNYTVTATDAVGASAGATITVTLRPDTSTGSIQDVDFCTATNGSSSPAPTAPSNVTNGGVGQPDQGTFTTNASGQFTFGILANQPGTANIQAFYDANNNGVFNAGEPQSQATATFASGGAPGSNAQADIVRCVDATPESATNVVGETHTFKARLTNNSPTPTTTGTPGTTVPDSGTSACAGNVVPGVTPVFTVTGGAGNLGPISCGQSDNQGVSTCSYTRSVVTNDTITVYVNQSAGSTGAQEAGEPGDTITKQYIAAQTGNTVAVTCAADPGAVAGNGTDTTGSTASTANSAGGSSTCTNSTTDPDRVFTATVKNAGATPVAQAGILVRFTVTGDATPATFDCTTNTSGQCSVLITDADPVSGEKQVVTATIRGTTNSGSATLTFANQPSDARNIAISPTSANLTPQQVQTFSATVTDLDGQPVPGVSVTFSENGPGFFRNNNTSVTDANGVAQVDFTSGPSETGSNTVTATISSTNTQCGSTAGTGTSPGTTPQGGTTTPKSTATAGNCTASAKVTIANASPTVSPTVSPTQGARRTLTLVVNTPTIPAGSTGRLTATGEANQAYQLMCYTRPSTTYFVARSGSFNATGDPVTFVLALGRNTRCFIQYATNSAQGFSGSVVINVRTVLSLSTVRTGVRTYIFQGRNLPRVAGQLITLYRVDNAGNEIRTSNLVTDNSGIYRVTRKFLGTGTFQFKVRTSQTLNNAAGVSNTITVRVF